MPHGMELTPPSLNLKELLETIMTFSRDDGKCNLLEVALEVQEFFYNLFTIYFWLFSCSCATLLA